MNRLQQVFKNKLVLSIIAAVVLVAAVGVMVFLIIGQNGGEPPPDGSEYAPPFTEDGPQGISVSEDTEWRTSVLSSPLIAEIEHIGVSYEVRIYSSLKYIHNTETGELVSGSTPGDATGTVLRDWVVPFEPADLVTDDALFDGCWANVGTRLRSLIAFCEENYELVTRARTADYLEYVYKDSDGKHWRIAATDDYILYDTLDFAYIFDIEAY
jgi:hypothetical protein